MTVSEYNRCVDQFSDGVYRFILHNLKDKDDSKDVVQDTYEKLWMNYSNVNFEKAKSYIFTTAYRTMIDKIRRSKKSVRLELSEVNVYDESRQHPDLKKILNEAMDKLSEIQKSVIMLRDFEGYTYEEIGEITGLNESQVKVYIYRARLALKEYIGSIENVI
jgi:RNA polymerase sigma-70 factor (ECF subfamily)